MRVFFRPVVTDIPAEEPTATLKESVAVVKFCDLLADYLEKEKINPAPKKVKNKRSKRQHLSQGKESVIMTMIKISHRKRKNKTE